MDGAETGDGSSAGRDLSPQPGGPPGTFCRSHLRDLGELGVGLAAPVRRLHRRLVVVHEGSVEPQLAGLEAETLS